MLDGGPPVCYEQYQIDLLLLCIFDQLRNRRSDQHLSDDLGGISVVVFPDAPEFLFSLLQHKGLARLLARFFEQREMRRDYMHDMHLEIGRASCRDRV